LVSNEKYVTVAGQEGTKSAGNDLSVFGQIQAGKETRIKPIISTSDPFDTIQADFVPLGGNESRLQRADLNSSSDDDSLHYRSIHGKAKPSNVPQDPDLEFREASAGSEMDRRKESTNDILLKNITFSKRAEAEPASGEAWQALIAHQDEMLLLHSAKRKPTTAERLSNADIKLTMYEKALLKVEDALWKERLTLGMMEEAGQLWDTEKLASRWQMILKENPSCLTLWNKYIDFEQTSLSSFRFHDLQRAFARCLQLLQDIPNGDPNGIFLSVQLYLILRFTVCMRDSGFPEQSVAIWQGLLEFNICRPTTANQQAEPSVLRKQLLDDFEAFWDSEVPRIGEEGSAGWVAYVPSQGQPPKPRVDKPLPQGTTESLLQSWSQYETAGYFQGRHPARTIDDTGEDDPYRVVLFSDIKDYLLSLPSPNHQALITAFLAFCGLPPPEDTPPEFLVWWKDPFVRSCGLHPFETALKQLSSSSGAANLQHMEAHSEPKDNVPGSTITFCVPTRDLFFAKPGSWLSAFDEWTRRTADNTAPVDANWTLRVVRGLVRFDMKNNNLAEYLIALELHANIETGKKSAKFLVKRRSSHLRFYCAYAIAEFRLGRSNSANNVLTTAINMSKSLDTEAQKETILLWQTLVWENLNHSGPDEALVRLLTIADNEVKQPAKGTAIKPHAGDILRTQKVSVNTTLPIYC
jgi:hypothetical protein